MTDATSDGPFYIPETSGTGWLYPGSSSYAMNRKHSTIASARGTRVRAARPRMRGVTRVLAMAALVGASCAMALTSVVPAEQATEYQVKAAYLFNFAKFVTWPTAAERTDPSFTVCVLGRDPFGSALETTVSGEKIRGKPVVLKRVATAKEASGCRIIFISSSEEPKLKRVLSEMDPGTLTVSDMPHFVDNGGMIQFVPEGKRVRFEVNLTAAEKSGLALSSELLKVATNVRRES
ncbi:MAG: YfiR family protein [Terriglobales bacterium]